MTIRELSDISSQNYARIYKSKETNKYDGNLIFEGFVFNVEHDLLDKVIVNLTTFADVYIYNDGNSYDCEHGLEIYI